jgi:hypothetical protein
MQLMHDQVFCARSNQQATSSDRKILQEKNKPRVDVDATAQEVSAGSCKGDAAGRLRIGCFSQRMQCGGAKSCQESSWVRRPAGSATKDKAKVSC